MVARTLLRKLVTAGGIAGWFGFNAVMAFYTYLWRNSPDAPDFAAGLTMPMHQHSRIFYVQVWEQRIALVGLAVSLALVVLAAVSGYAFYRQELAPRRGLFWLNGCALAAFLAWFVYAAWPLAVGPGVR